LPLPDKLRGNAGISSTLASQNAQMTSYTDSRHFPIQSPYRNRIDAHAAFDTLILVYFKMCSFIKSHKSSSYPMHTTSVCLRVSLLNTAITRQTPIMVISVPILIIFLDKIIPVAQVIITHIISTQFLTKPLSFRTASAIV
jgi:hypothetical protein